MKKIAILGVSGSIGQSTIEVLKKHREQFTLVGISVYHNIDCLNDLLQDFLTIEVVGVKSLLYVQSYILNYPHVKFIEGEKGLESVATCHCDLVLNALVGFVGLKPTIQAIQAHKDIALANKETLVAGGELITQLIKEYGVHLYPVDSEHSAIFQCLEKNEPHKIILTASGGPFYQKTLNEIQNVSIKEALAHPNWKMGKKITIDSATMMNKAFEIIEAKWLFDLKEDEIEVVIHPQSIIHSMVEFKDGAIKAQLGTPDMKVPIAYALSYPKRLDNITSFLSFKETKKLDFYPIDLKRFEAIDLAYQALKEKGTYATVMNAANEVAVEMFLKKQISFGSILNYIKETLSAHQNCLNLTLEKIVQADAWAREYTRRLIQNDLSI